MSIDIVTGLVELRISTVDNKTATDFVGIARVLLRNTLESLKGLWVAEILSKAEIDSDGTIFVTKIRVSKQQRTEFARTLAANVVSSAREARKKFDAEADKKSGKTSRTKK